MKATVKKTLFIAGVILILVGVLAFVGCLVASSLVWTPGVPSPMAQALTIIAACGLPVSMVGMILASID